MNVDFICHAWIWVSFVNIFFVNIDINTCFYVISANRYFLHTLIVADILCVLQFRAWVIEYGTSNACYWTWICCHSCTLFLLMPTLLAIMPDTVLSTAWYAVLFYLWSQITRQTKVINQENSENENSKKIASPWKHYSGYEHIEQSL